MFLKSVIFLSKVSLEVCLTVNFSVDLFIVTKFGVIIGINNYSFSGSNACLVLPGMKKSFHLRGRY